MVSICLFRQFVWILDFGSLHLAKILLRKCRNHSAPQSFRPTYQQRHSRYVSFHRAPRKNSERCPDERNCGNGIGAAVLPVNHGRDGRATLSDIPVRHSGPPLSHFPYSSMSFPRRRESRQAPTCLNSPDWIPAFAGMTRPAPTAQNGFVFYYGVCAVLI